MATSVLMTDATYNERPNVLDVMRFQNTTSIGTLKEFELFIDDKPTNLKSRLRVKSIITEKLVLYYRMPERSM